VKPRQAEPVCTKNRTDKYAMGIGCIADCDPY